MQGDPFSSVSSRLFDHLLFTLYIKEGFLSLGYGDAQHSTPNTGQMRLQQFISHMYSQPRGREDTTLLTGHTEFVLGNRVNNQGL